MPHRFASANLSFSGTVVRNEEADPRIRNQMQVAVEVLSISRMPKDPVSISGLLVKSQRHPIQVRQIRKLARVHQLSSFWTEYLSSCISAVLQIRDHEVLHVSARYRRTARWSSFHELKRLCGF